jgi:hypothetical protein
VIRHVGITNDAYVVGPQNSDMATGVTADQRSALRALRFRQAAFVAEISATVRPLYPQAVAGTSSNVT